MGCVSSKFVEEYPEKPRRNGAEPNCTTISHVVSLTSTTYGALNLDKEKQHQEEEQEEEVQTQCAVETKKPSPARDEPSEIINAWELMEGLEEEVPTAAAQSKWSPKSRLFDAKSPLKFINQMASPRKAKKVGGKENRGRINGGIRSLENSPKLVLKECNNNNSKAESMKKPSPRLWASIKGSPNVKRSDSLRIDTGAVQSRKSLSPLFGPALAPPSPDKEVLLSQEEEEIKTIVSVSSALTSWKARHSQDSEAMLDLYEKKCPPGGENAVVIYTTTLRGIRKTFEDCNIARSIIESQNVQILERDVSMHSGYKEELRALMNSREVRVPLVFVKGRLIGGAEEMLKLDEGGKLGTLFDGIPKAAALACVGCAGFRFVMCMVCNGSCKLMGMDGKKSVRCNKCNENGLIQCPLCC